ncbi:hypothetical protein JCM8097_007940 [Rhodosporidiobolus ruineniae]
MADSDFDDDLLALAEGTSKRKSSSKSSKPNKRRRPADSDSDGSASDMDMSQSDSDAPAAPSPRAGKRSGGRVKSAAQVDSSDEDSDDEPSAKPTADNPYPYEGLFVDAAEKRRIMGMSEFEREEILSSRKDEMTERDLRKQVAVMANKSSGRAAADDDEDEEEDDDDEEYGARGTRSRKATGASKSKAEGLEKLKRSRAEKGKKKEKKDDSDDEYEEGGKSRRRRDTSDEESGSEADSEDDSRGKKSAKGKKKAEPAGPEDLQSITISRSKLAELSPAPWFEKWVVGAFVRYSVGMDDRGQPQYRLCEVVGAKRQPEKSYRIDTVTTDVHLELQHGKAVKFFSMDAVSNSPVTPAEYIRLQKTCQVDKTDFPSPRDVARVKEQLAKHTSYILTEEDLAKRLAEKGKKKTGAALKAQLRMERDQAVSTNDHARVSEIDAEIADIDRAAANEKRETASKLNERNRLSNREEVRRAEARGQEERRRQQEALAKGDTSVKVDASARVKTVPRMNYDSRPQTPNPGTPGGSGRATPSNLGPGGAQNGTPAGGARPAKGGKIESTVASRVQLDLDLDF